MNATTYWKLKAAVIQRLERKIAALEAQLAALEG